MFWKKNIYIKHISKSRFKITSQSIYNLSEIYYIYLFTMLLHEHKTFLCNWKAGI